MKDAEAPENLTMSLKSVELGVAKDGKRISSAVLIRNDEVQIRSKITQNQLQTNSRLFMRQCVSMATSRNWGMLSLKSQYLWRDGARFFTKDLQPINKILGGKILNELEKILLKMVFLRSMMISTPLKSMMPDRPDMTRTINIMSGAELPDGQDTPLRGVLVSGAVLMIDCYIELYAAPL